MSTALVTGGAGGLGLVTARRLAGAGMDLVLVGRDTARTAAAAESLGGARAYVADLSEWDQVRELVAKVAADGVRVDVLVNNAGGAFPRYAETVDGVERTYAINHYAPFLLTRELVAAGVLAVNARIVNVSTFVEKRGRLEVGDPDVTGTSWRDRFYSQLHVYGTSKLLSLLAGRELARRLPDGMRVYSADPGMVRGTAINASAGGLMRVTAPLFRPFSRTADEGVRTAVWLATAVPPPEPNGGFFADARPATPSPLGRDDVLARRVYERTVTVLGGDEKG